MNSHLPLPSKNLTLWKLGQSVQHQRQCPGFYPGALLLLLLNNYIAKGTLLHIQYWRNILRARGRTVLLSHSHVMWCMQTMKICGTIHHTVPVLTLSSKKKVLEGEKFDCE